MRLLSCLATASAAALVAASCTSYPSAPTILVSTGLSPNRNLEVVLRGDGFGLVKFRQPKDDQTIAYLDVWVRDLVPNTSYQLQRAVDTNIDDVCTSTAWLTLGKGVVPQAITTDDAGTGREALFRNLTSGIGAAFDIHFRVIEAATGAVVLQSACYQFEIGL
jgi:hypothetical protein